jgi:hypothetical protein
MYNFTHCFVWVWNKISCFKGRALNEADVSKQCAEEDMNIEEMKL